MDKTQAVFFAFAKLVHAFMHVFLKNWIIFFTGF